jgi:hypothetical protein
MTAQWPGVARSSTGIYVLNPRCLPRNVNRPPQQVLVLAGQYELAALVVDTGRCDHDAEVALRLQAVAPGSR